LLTGKKRHQSKQKTNRFKEEESSRVWWGEEQGALSGDPNTGMPGKKSHCL